MANKKVKEQRIFEERQRRYLKARSKSNIFTVLSLCACAVIFLLMFVTYLEVFNSSSGTEVRVGGWSFFLAGISNNYSSSDKIYGDIAVPFYYYAKSYCEYAGALTVAAVFCLIALLLTDIVRLFVKLNIFNYLSVLLSLACSTLIFITFIVCLNVSNAKVLSDYCGGNPACSIHSYAVIPFIFALASFVFDLLALVKIFGAKKQLKLEINL